MSSSASAAALFDASAPANPSFHLFDSDLGPHVFLPDGSRVYGLSAQLRARFLGLRQAAPQRVEQVLRELGALGRGAPYIGEDEVPQDPPLRAVSLAIAQKCNLGCTYCYAQQGDFGLPTRNMSREVARRTIEHLVDGAAPGERVHVSFLGGEPLINREVLQETTEFAAARARARGVRLGFAITTNGTLFSEADGAFFERHGFAVTVSLDGVGAAHDRQRPFRGGQGSFATILARVEPWLARQRRMQLSARVTVTPDNLQLPETLAALVRMGFHSVGFSPMLASPTGAGRLEPEHFEPLLEQMVACAEQTAEAIIAGRRYPFSNLVDALREIHRGTHRPYPCGAGAGYLGVSADGDFAACHRFVGDDAGALGDIAAGVDPARQSAWLRERHVHRQEPCTRCWARYLCGGGCHHEVIHRGRPACDYIRGWLHACLRLYVRVLAERPGYFGAGRRLPTA